MDLISDQGLRTDGRRPAELRMIRCKLGVFSQPEGSAYLEQGNTKVLAAVYGPHQVRGSKSKAMHDSVLINCQYSMATFSTGERKRRPRGDLRSTEMTLRLKQAMQSCIIADRFPYAQIDIFVEILQSDGGNFCACVNAATLALIDAGIPLRDYVIACSASLGNGTVPLVDISHLEESMGGTNLTIAMLPNSEEIAVLDMSQKLHIDNLPVVLNEAQSGCKQIYDILNTAIKSYIEEVGMVSGFCKSNA